MSVASRDLMRGAVLWSHRRPRGVWEGARGDELPATRPEETAATTTTLVEGNGAMSGSKFSPRLESLDARVCLSTVGGEVMVVDMFRPGEEAAAVDYFRTGEERGAAVDRFLVNNEKGEAGWDVMPGDEKGAAVDYGLLLPAVKVESGWDVQSGEERGAAVDYFPTDQIGGPYVGESGWDKQP